MPSMGFRQQYKQTGSTSGQPAVKTVIDTGATGSHRDNNAKRGLSQVQVANAKPIGPSKNIANK